MLRRRATPVGLLSFLGAVACSDSAGPKLPPCTAAGLAVTLNVGEYVTIDPAPVSGCVVFPANGPADSAEYLLVPQLATGVPGKTSSYRLAGDTIKPAMLGPAFSAPTLADLAPAERFHAFLRLGDEARWRGLTPQIASSDAAALSAAVPAGPPALNSQRQFKVCSTITCSRVTTVTATVRALKSNVAIYVDTLAPAGGLDSAALDTLATLFETRLYPTDTAAFGRESDIDANSVLLVLMTPVVNKLVTKAQCQSSGFVAGFFFGGDLQVSYANSNRGELFYSLVADPTGTLSCAHSTTSVQRIVPVTFIHEFQHMISYNQHVLVKGGAGEVLWLNEGLSHYAEELGGRTYAPGTPEFSRFTIGNLYNAYQYLDSTRTHFLLPTEGIGSLAERGAMWLFVRYVVDRYAGDTSVTAWNALTRQMLATSSVGWQNVDDIARGAGDTFRDVVTRWALANWVSDLPGFTAPTGLKYDSWDFRATYASLNAQDNVHFPKTFPLTPTSSAGRAVSLTGTLRAGSGVYTRAFQAPSAPGFTLLFGTSGGGPLNPGLFPRLNVIRIR